jgi:serine/threonine protein phosphatase PrpC
MKETTHAGNGNDGFLQIHKRISALEWETLRQNDLTRYSMVRRLEDILTQSKKGISTCNEAIKSLGENLRLLSDETQDRLLLLEKKIADTETGDYCFANKQVRIEDIIGAHRRVLLTTVLQTQALTEEISRLKEQTANEAAQLSVIARNVLHSQAKLQAEIRRTRESYAKVARILKRRIETKKRSGEKNSCESLSSHLVSAEGGNRHINEVVPDKTIVAGVVSARGEVPSKNDDYGTAFSDGKLVTACVCDGVGSSKNGGECAKLAARSFLVFSRCVANQQHENLDTHEAVCKSFVRATESIAGQDFHESTMIAAVMDADTRKLSLGWMGDGTAMLISREGVRKLLRPHHNESHEITRFIAGDGHGGCEPEIEDFTLEPGEVVLLASDGFGDFELDHDILKRNVLDAINAFIPAEKVCAKLVSDAISAGADDNVTVALIGLRNPVPPQYQSSAGCSKEREEAIVSAGSVAV